MFNNLREVNKLEQQITVMWILVHVHFTPHSFHPSCISPLVHFTPLEFHSTFFPPNNVWTHWIFSQIKSILHQLNSLKNHPTFTPSQFIPPHYNLNPQSFHPKNVHRTMISPNIHSTLDYFTSQKIHPTLIPPYIIYPTKNTLHNLSPLHHFNQLKIHPTFIPPYIISPY